MDRTFTRRFGPLLLGLAVTACGAPSSGPVPRQASVFFPAWSAQFDDGASAVVRQVAKEMRSAPNRSVTVVGSADPLGSPQANEDISRLRAQVVFDGLVADGVDPVRIRREQKGATKYVSMPQESRRVDLIVTD